jgi:hypothetical protein
MIKQLVQSMVCLCSNNCCRIIASQVCVHHFQSRDGGERLSCSWWTLDNSNAARNHLLTSRHLRFVHAQIHILWKVSKNIDVDIPVGVVSVRSCRIIASLKGREIHERLVLNISGRLDVLAQANDVIL